MANRFFKPQKAAQKQSSHLVGKIIEGHVRDVINNGAGVIAGDDGFTIFVWGVWVGERALVKITSVKKRIAHAELIEVITPSTERRDVKCPYAHGSSEGLQCGGCLWQHVKYEAQIVQKQKWCESAFDDLAPSIKPCEPSDSEWGYRNRAELKSDGRKLGYIARQTHQLIDVVSCPVLNEKCSAHLSHLRAALPNPLWQKRRAKGEVPLTLLAIDEDLASVDIEADKRRPFKQGNSAQNQFMREWLSAKLKALPKSYKVAELFCGSGNFTEVIAAHGFSRVDVTEGDAAALDALSAKRLACVYPEVVNAFDEELFSKYIRKIAPFEVLVLDPPRDGLRVIEPLLAVQSIRHIFYISCDLATCRRDVGRFVEAGFQVAEVQPLDQFPQTPHVELCVSLSKGSL